jgi:hypothetical protein
MSFSFLYPLLWLGALAVAAPLWLHLRRKQEQNLQQFSAVRFLEDAPQPRRAPLQLRDVMLFALRVLGLLLLVAAFAWPFLREAANRIVAESRVYILDNTLSHQADDGFGRDRDRLVKELAQADRRTQIAVIELTSQPRVVASFGDDRDMVKQKVQELKPSFQRGSYLAAFRLANTLLANSLGGKKHIVVLGDNQENQWTEYQNTPPFLRDVEVTLPDVRALQSPNLALAEPHVERVFLGDKSLVNFTVRFNHQGGAKQAVITLLGNSQTIFRRTAELAGQPEQMVLQAQWEVDPSLWLRGEVSVEGQPDALAGDNRVFFCVPPVQEGTVALLAQSKYLRLALSPDTMRGRWATRVLEPSRLADEVAAGRDAEVLCLESNYLQSADARRLMMRYLNNGRGVLLLVNRVSPLIIETLRDLGFDPQDEVTTPTSFYYVYANHPIFHPFVSSDFGNLGEVKVLRRTRLKAGQAVPLIFSEKGDALMFQGARASGKLFVCTFGLDRGQTTWPVHPTFIPFLDLCLQTARAEDTTPTTFEPGELCMMNLPADSPVREVVLRDGARELLRAPVVEHRVQFAVPATPGLYTVTHDASKTVEKMLAVNPSPKESSLTYVASPEALTAWKLPDTRSVARAASTDLQSATTLASILQQRIWWWMLLSGAAVLVMETFWVTAMRVRE